MGLFGIPLDIMTITVAAISVGMAVDNTIHYIHRFKKEFANSGNYKNSMHNCKKVLSIPLFPEMLNEEIDYIVDSINKFNPYWGL